MLKRILDYHSGRSIALCRLVLAAVFLLVLSADPDQPVRNSVEGYLVLVGYAAFALGLLVWCGTTGGSITPHGCPRC